MFSNDLNSAYEYESERRNDERRAAVESQLLRGLDGKRKLGSPLRWRSLEYWQFSLSLSVCFRDANRSMNMNKKLFLTVIALVALLAVFFATSGLDSSSTVTAQEQVAVPRFILVANEPAVQMWSGPIQFSDNNSPDFRPHTTLPLKQSVTSECISEESTNPRRWGGCIQ